MKAYLLVKDNLEKKQLCDSTITLQIVNQIRILPWTTGSKYGSSWKAQDCTLIG